MKENVTGHKRYGNREVTSMPYFENRGARIYYEEKGRGKALLFLHGASLNLGQWKRETEHFSKNYRVIAPDARGHGKSTLPPGKVSPDIFWQDADALLTHLNIESAVICGLSLGAHTALQMAIHAPQKVEALILIGAPCTNRFNLYERICVPINRFFMKLLPMSWTAMCMSFILAKSPETKRYIKNTVSTLDHKNFSRVWDAVTRMESQSGLSKIKCPALILIGDHDSLTMRQQPFIHQSITGSKLVTIRHAHHAASLDNPVQVEREMECFLNSLPGDTF